MNRKQFLQEIEDDVREHYDTSAGKPASIGAIFGSLAIVALFLCAMAAIWRAV